MIAAGAKGSSLPIRQPDRVGWDPIRGATRWAVWRCIDNTQINTLAAQAAAVLLPYNIISTGTTHTIEVEILGGAVDPAIQVNPQDRWEMPGNEIQRTQWEHPKLLSIPAEVIGLAANSVQTGIPYSQFVIDPSDPIGALSVDQIDALYAAYQLTQRGSTHYALGQYVLKHTTNVASNYAANVSDFNVEKIYTTAQLLAEVTDRTFWLYPLPPRMVWKIQSLRVAPPQSGYLWGWRKLPSTETAVAGGRIEIVTEYWLEQWSLFDYDPVA